MVGTGKPIMEYGSVVSTEVVDLSDTSKSCEASGISFRYGSVGEILGNTPIICGGYGDDYLKECLVFGTSKVITMNNKRIFSSSVALNTSMLWIMGGYDGNYLDSTEFVTTDGAVNGPKLPEPIRGSCAVIFRGDTYLVGGDTLSGNSVDVWVTNPSKPVIQWDIGPQLITGRYYHSCSTMSVGSKIIIVAAGGYNENNIQDYNNGYLASVEILELDPIPNPNQWIAGN